LSAERRHLILQIDLGLGVDLQNRVHGLGHINATP
jgi:hypothetical protein